VRWKVVFLDDDGNREVSAYPGSALTHRFVSLNNSFFLEACVVGQMVNRSSFFHTLQKQFDDGHSFQGFIALPEGFASIYPGNVGTESCGTRWMKAT
jgi:hypothetical protein